jgi:hypothetical protein
MPHGRKPLLRPLPAGAWVVAILAVVLCSGSAGAQTQPALTPPATVTPTAGILRIRSEPSGVLVRLIGDHRWSGTTPWDLQRGIEGSFVVVADVEGYEKWERTIHLTKGEVRDLEILLTPKQAWKAGLRSAILPGWGQFYTDQTAKGGAFLIGTATAAGVLIWAQSNYENHVEDYNDAQNAYLEETHLEDLESLHAAAERAHDRADDAYDRRQLALYITAGLYAASILDAVLLFPGTPQGGFASISPWGEKGPQLALGGSPRGDLTLALRWTPREGGAR